MAFGRKKATAEVGVSSVQTGKAANSFGTFAGASATSAAERAMYSTLKENVPIIDAAIKKLVRLLGSFNVICSDKRMQNELDTFLASVSVGGNQTGIEAFVFSYFEQLLTYGTAIGEVVTDKTGRVRALFNAALSDIELRRAKNGFDVDILIGNGFDSMNVKYPELILLSVLNPEPGEVYGSSLLKGLPFLSDVLMNIFTAIGTNWERLGNLRFAVTYKPQNDTTDRAFAKERAMQVAKEWSEAMQAGSTVRDFVAVGDVSIKVIGADNQMLDSEVPVRQITEQLIAKTGIPPFMLGLSWSSTERMSAQQADMLTSEMEFYRGLLTPVIRKICSLYLGRSGIPGDIEVEWSDIMLQDQVEIGRARLYEAQAEKIIEETGKEMT